MTDKIIQEAALSSGAAYTAVGTYDQAEMIKLVGKLSATTKVPVPDLLRAYGEHLFTRFAVRYPQFFGGVSDCFSFLARIEAHIHVDVNKLCPDAELPSIQTDMKDENTLELVFYVWFDAPIAYIATTQGWADVDPTHRDWRSWWWKADDVDYIQFLGKDNVPFHAVSFPCTLIGSGEPWKTVDVIKGVNWLSASPRLRGAVSAAMESTAGASRTSWSPTRHVCFRRQLGPWAIDLVRRILTLSGLEGECAR